MTSVGFIGLGNVGGKLAGSLLRNGFDTTVRDLDKTVAQPFLDQGASWADSPREMADRCDLVITCLPSPKACAAVMEGPDGILEGISEGKIWAEMSTTDVEEVKRLGTLVEAKGASAIECPVSGGCHRGGIKFRVVHTENEPRAAIFQLKVEFAGRVKGVAVYTNSAGLENAEENLGKLGNVGEKYGHLIPLFDPLFH